MLAPVAVYFIVFSFYPLGLGVYTSFFEVRILGDSTFIGLDNYAAVVSHPFYRQALANTLVVNFSKFALQFIFGLLIALLLNEVKSNITKSTIQTATYLPYLLSWSVVGALWINILSPTGMLNGFMRLILGESHRMITFMAEPSMARIIFILTGAWKDAGYTAVLFLAAIVSIDPSIYEAAAIDGASRFQQIRKIIIPNLGPIMKTIVLLSMMGIMRNFDQVFVMTNAVINPRVRNLAFFIFNEGLAQLRIGPAVAAATLILLATLIITIVVRKLVKYDQTFN